MRYTNWFLFLTAVMLSSCILQKPAVPEAPSRAYQHFSKPCKACHGTEKPPSGGVVFAAGFDVTSSCLVCHDYKENHHPTDFVPVNPVKSEFPLSEGKITCLTCHVMHGGAGKEGTSKLLRNGPYRDRRDICFQCHSREAYALIDPHKMLNEQNKVIDVNGKPVCLICHTTTPDSENDVTATVKFRADVGFLCWRCHPPMQGDFFRQHFLAVPSAKVLNNMNRSQESLYVILPLVPRGRITCSTCHNPHQEGVIKREPAAKGADTRAKLRLADSCFACHGI